MLPDVLKPAADAYIELERRIDSLVPPACIEACAACGGRCCRAGMANQTIRTWWLREVSVRAHGRWWPDDWADRSGCVALGPAGCLLSAGRPVNCRTWYCQPWLDACRSPWEALFCALLCELLPWTVRLGPQLSLLELTEADAPRYAGLIAANIERSARLLEKARGLVDDGRGVSDRPRLALEVVCTISGLLQPGLAERMLAGLR